MHPDCAGSGANTARRWIIRFADSPPGVFSKVTERQWIGQMMTMIAIRDNKRQSDGMVAVTGCHLFKMVTSALMFLLFVCCCTCIPLLCFILVSAPMHDKLYELEKRWCPRRTKKITR